MENMYRIIIDLTCSLHEKLCCFNKYFIYPYDSQPKYENMYNKQKVWKEHKIKEKAWKNVSEHSEQQAICIRISNIAVVKENKTKKGEYLIKCIRCANPSKSWKSECTGKNGQLRSNIKYVILSIRQTILGTTKNRKRSLNIENKLKKQECER